MIWFYFLAPIGLLLLAAFIYDRRHKLMHGPNKSKQGHPYRENLHHSNHVDFHVGSGDDGGGSF
ncbi:hypothetical protein [Pseudalkalibacillus sp. SCS-8]|uniref:hypothetical protein n=1 Tax=Pseudalkalibacillus nanhaiensis TaxID=3115291 RepID=UPI0032DB860C